MEGSNENGFFTQSNWALFLCVVTQKRRRGKKNKKKKDALGMEQLDSLKSGAPSTDCSVVSERSCDPFPASESTTQEDEAAKPGAALPAGRTAGETKSSDSVGSLGDENKNTEMAVRDHCSSSTSLQDDACAKTAQPTGSTAPQEKMEDGNPKGDGQKGREERASEKQEDARSPAETEQPLGKASDAQTSGADGDAPGSKGAGEGDSPGLPTSAETPENEEASPSAEAVNQKSKVSPTEPPDTRSRGGKVEQESKQQAHAPASKATSQVRCWGPSGYTGMMSRTPLLCTGSQIRAVFMVLVLTAAVTHAAFRSLERTVPYSSPKTALSPTRRCAADIGYFLLLQVSKNSLG